MVKAMTPVRFIDLVEPLAHKVTAMRTADTSGTILAASGAVSQLIGEQPSAGRRSKLAGPNAPGKPPAANEPNEG